MTASGKYSKSAREAALQALVRYEQDQAYLNLALPAVVENLPADERALGVFIARMTVQRLNTLDWALNLYSRRSLDSMTPWIRNLLRISACQLLYMDRIPAYAVVNEAVKLARRYGHRGVTGLVNALLRRLSAEADRLPWPDREKAGNRYLALKYSVPEWLAARMVSRYGFQETENWARVSNLKPAVSIRPNRLKVTSEKLQEKLAGEGLKVEPSSMVPGMLHFPGGSDPAGTEMFRSGLYTIQGESSSLVAPLLEPCPGEIVFDLCSAPGGKATHLAELIDDRGQVFAIELQKSRLQLIKKASARLGLQSVQEVHADGRNIEKENLPAPGAVLVDAPCSGLGVIRRLPEIKWRRSEAVLPEMQKLQLELLTAAARILLPGGKLMYSVCSTEPEETSRVVEEFNQSHPDFKQDNLHPLVPQPLRDKLELASAITLWPHHHGLDGFFIARWSKKG
ncbi:MAG: 16S rRNA (cytosine(967)-C(5))-methyltransferase RsmB [Bacillota bacterium]